MFEDRERAYEAKFAHDQEMRFLAIARRDKLLAHTVATKFKIAEDQLTSRILALQDGPGHDERVIQAVTTVLQNHGSTVPDADIAGWLAECAIQAAL